MPLRSVVSSFEVRRGSIDPKMKLFVAAVAAALAITDACPGAEAGPSPGGYTLKGGVYNFQRPLDYMQDATSAGEYTHKKNDNSAVM